MAARRMGKRMPSARALLAAGRGDLAGAIARRGGYSAAAQQLGLAWTGRKPRGYWRRFANLERELRAFIRDTRGLDPRVLPTRRQLAAAGRMDLASAIGWHGGFARVARQLGLGAPPQRHKPAGYWDNPANLRRELRAFARRQGHPRMMPTDQELQSGGWSSLANAVVRLGGYGLVAGQVGLRPRRAPTKPAGYWAVFANLKRELMTYLAEQGLRALPAESRLAADGRSDLAAAIRRHHGGLGAVARRLHLGRELGRGQAPRSQQDFARLARALADFAQGHGTPGIMPTRKELSAGSRSDLARAVDRGGGFRAVAARAGLRERARPAGYWRDFANLARELKQYMQARGGGDVLPTQKELSAAHATPLIYAIAVHGGAQSVARRLGLRVRPRGVRGGRGSRRG